MIRQGNQSPDTPYLTLAELMVGGGRNERSATYTAGMLEVEPHCDPAYTGGMAEPLSQPERRPSLQRQSGNVFVGRQREMVVLTAALDDSLAGRGRLVMLAGEPGIGKTRTSQELAGLAQRRGAHTVWGWCYEQQGAPPYWPWTQPILSFIQNCEPNQLMHLLGPNGSEICEIVPELLEKLPGLQPPPPQDPAQARFRLFGSITAFIKRAAQAQPLVIVLDDLHWADQPSLLLLEFIARQMADIPLMILGCYRDAELSRHHPLSETLSRLSRETVFVRQPLRGLSHEDTRNFIQAVTGEMPSQELADTVFDHTEGNPFFTAEVVRLLSDRGELIEGRIGTTDGIRIPEGVREVVGQHLNRLSDLCNETLIAASVIGREFPFNLLGLLDQEHSEADLLGAMDEAVAARLIEELPGSTDRYRFGHTLVQQTLLDELTTSRRVRLHARIGSALETLLGDSTDLHSAELAYHFSEGEAAVGPGKMIHYHRVAGDRALDVHAPEEALIHFQHALAVKEEQPIDSETAALFFGLGKAQSATVERHRLSEAVASLGRAFDYYLEVGDMDRAVMVADCPLPNLTGAHTAMASLFERALELVPPDSHHAGRLLSRRGWELGRVAGDYDTAQLAFSRALTIARREGDVALEMRTLVSSASVDFAHTRYRENLEKSLKAIALAPSVNDANAELDAHRTACLSFRNTGDLEGARFHAQASLALAEGLQTRGWLALVLAANSTLFQLAGDWTTAREYSDRGLEVSLMDSTLLASRVLLEYEVGEFQQGEMFLDRLVDVMGQTESGPWTQYSYVAIAIPLAARIAGVKDRFDVAASAAGTVLSSKFASPLFTEKARASLGLMAVEEGDLDSCHEQYAALVDQSGTILTGVLASVDRILGLLSASMGNIDQASIHFDDAMAFCRKAGYRPELAWTCQDYAEALLPTTRGPSASSGRTNDEYRAKAMTLLEESLAITTDLGMLPLMERATALKTSLCIQPAAQPGFPAGLTQREVEVIRLIAGGKTDRQIAETLIISVNTVGNHVRSILNKTNAANRAEAAAYAIQHSLMGTAMGILPDGLTSREVEVLRLIARGKTNIEIAEELFIAEGTTRRHVANIYEKISAANRAEATRYALREGIALDETE